MPLVFLNQTKLTIVFSNKLHFNYKVESDFFNFAKTLNSKLQTLNQQKYERR